MAAVFLLKLGDAQIVEINSSLALQIELYGVDTMESTKYFSLDGENLWFEQSMGSSEQPWWWPHGAESAVIPQSEPDASTKRDYSGVSRF